MSQPYTTRSRAAALPADLVRLMASTAYEASRGPGSARPPYADTAVVWQTSAEREMTAAIQAAEAAGMITINHRSTT